MKYLPFLILLFHSSAWGAVGYDTTVTQDTRTDATHISLTINTSGANRLIACGVHMASAYTVTGVTHNSVALTQSAIGKITASTYSVDVWVLKAQDSGSQTVTATLSGGDDFIAMGCISFTGVDQTTPLGTGASFSATTDPSSATITIPTDGGGVCFDTNNDQTNAGSYTVDGSSTKRYDLANNGGDVAFIGSTRLTSGSATMTISNPATEYSAMICLPINAAAAATQRPIPPIVFQ